MDGVGSAHTQSVIEHRTTDPIELLGHGHERIGDNVQRGLAPLLLRLRAGSGHAAEASKMESNRAQRRNFTPSFNRELELSMSLALLDRAESGTLGWEHVGQSYCRGPGTRSPRCEGVF
jgi:hypothetical protein